MKMTTMVVGASLGAMALAVSAAAGSTLTAAVVLAIPAMLPPPPQPTENPSSEAKRVLGKILFWDEQLSSDNTTSCGTCHMPESGSSDGRQLRHLGPDGVSGTGDDSLGSPGVRLSTSTGLYARDPMFGYQVQGTRRLAGPAVMSAYFMDLFWDGRARSRFVDPVSGSTVIASGGALESQSVGPPLSAVEMAHAGRDWPTLTAKLTGARPLALATGLPADVQAVLAANPSYPDLFQAAFGSSAIKANAIARAIGVYERTLVADQTPWDAYDAGDESALTADEVRGMTAFDASACTFCHVPPLFMDDTFSNIGVRPVSEDIGRQAVTGLAFDGGSFKTPSLRNAGLRPAFMHNGQFSTLDEVVRFYGQLPGAAPRFTDNIHPLIPLLSVDPVEAPFIVQFMQTALTDPRVAAAQFPFDHPTLFSHRAGSHLETITDSGVPGAAGVKPAIILDNPPMIGNNDFRVGVYNGLTGAQARLAFSASPPVAGKLTGPGMFGAYTLLGTAASDGHYTLLMPLPEGVFADGEVLYFQWIVQDPAAPGGESATEAVRVTFFCARDACAPACDPDVNQDGNVDQDDVSYLINVVGGGDNPTGIDPDFNRDGNVDQDDVGAIINVIAGGACP